MTKWWELLLGRAVSPSPSDRPAAVQLTVGGWTEEAAPGDLRAWRDRQGDVLTLSLSAPTGALEMLREQAVKNARDLAESRHAGLIEVRFPTGPLGPVVSLIYKQLRKPAYIFTGMLLVPREDHIWTVIAGERGTTGVREAVITAELMNSGKLTFKNFERLWARDPYDPGYRGVDVSVLRFMSDDERYDERFPAHSLSKVRRILAALPGLVQLGSPGQKL